MNNLAKLILKALNLKEANFSKSISIKNCDEWDSANHMMLIVEIERKFKIRLKNNEIIKMTSYKNIEKILKQKKIKL